MASTGIASDYLENELVDHALRGLSFTAPASHYIALFDVDPGDDGTAGTEVSGGSYAREAATFAAPANGTTSNSGIVTFNTPTADWGNVQGWAVFDAVTSGNMLFHGTLDNAVYISEGQVAEFAVGALELTLS